MGQVLEGCGIIWKMSRGFLFFFFSSELWKKCMHVVNELYQAPRSIHPDEHLCLKHLTRENLPRESRNRLLVNKVSSDLGDPQEYFT